MIRGKKIRNIFLPDCIGSYYLFSHRIVACEITQTQVKVAVTKASGRSRTIEHMVEVPIAPTAASPATSPIGGIPETPKQTTQSSAAEALTQALSSIGRYNELYAILPSNIVIFKELTLPFSSIEKIKLVLPFEVEPLLPFALSDAVVDCIITETHDTSSTVLAAAITNDLLAEQLAPFQEAGINPDRATVDIIELYALYRALYPDGTNDNVLLLHMGARTSRLGVIVKKQLKAARFLPYGINKLAQLLGYDVDQVMHSTLSPEEARASGAAITSFFSDIQFTLEAFTARAPEQEKLDKILLLGTGADVKGMASLIEHVTGLPCDIVNGQAIIQHNLANLKGNHGIPNRSIISASTALALPVSQDFNLYTASEALAQDTLMNRRLITAFALMLLIMGSVIVHGFLNARRLKQEIQASEKEAANRLKRELPNIAARVKSNSLDLIKNAARNEVAREKNIWFALSNQSRSSFLIYLQELSRRIDTAGLGLLLTRLTLTDDSLVLEGQVKDYEALKQLEEDLRRSKMFTSVQRLQELKFTAKLPIDKNYGETQ